MKKLFFITLLIAFCEHNLFAQSQAAKDEYNVYASILKTIYSENIQTYTNASEFVILQNTTVCDSDVSTDIKIKALKKNFEQKNQKPTVLERTFPVKYKYFLISQNDLDKFFEQGRIELEELRQENKSSKGMMTETGAEIWLPFYKKYSESQGYYSFSRVGFSLSKKFAMVCVNNDSNLFGFSRIYILKK